MTAVATEALSCSRCGSQLAPTLLSCPSCHSLVHLERLKWLTNEAQTFETAGDSTAALEHWRLALDLLPAESSQHPAITARIAALGKALPARAQQERTQEVERVRTRFAGKGGKAGSVLAAAAVLLWKLKFVVVLLLTKMKLLLFGFTKIGTLLSMLATIGAYWALWGWPFAVGFVLSIYVHEMGHVSALHHYGIRAGAPMFIPFVGAFVRLKESLRNDWENAMVGLAGPLWGVGASLAAYGLYAVTGKPIFAAIAHSGAWLNLFNLMPVWQLDGGRGFSAMSKVHRLVAAAALLGAFAVTREPMCLIVGLVGAGMAFTKPSREPDARIAAYYIGLAWVLAGLSMVSVHAARVR